MVQPSCPALLIHPDDAFRRALVVALDEGNFSVAFANDIDEAVDAVRRRAFRVIFVAVGDGGIDAAALPRLREIRESIGCGVILLSDPNPNVRSVATWADETFLKPVDVGYVASRAKRYCNC